MPAETVSYIGLGSNLADPVRQVRSAVAALACLPLARLDRCSSLFRSAPIGPVAQPDFINAVCRIFTRAAPEALMQALLDIEARQGRHRAGDKGGPRTLDLDLLLHGTERRHSPELELPHPRMHERAFVLAPLVELDPALVVPDRGRALDLLAGCTGQHIERLPD
jgi:2-amino-4-hydroxy-6-hydroxymethyldihydropteridine diphosphokinase